MASDYATITAKLMDLAHTACDIQSIIVIGSQARNDRPADAYSDLDLIVVVDDPEAYLSSSRWLEAIDNYWISFTEDTLGGGKERRVLFDGALDVDFLFFSVAGFRQAINDEDVLTLFARGYQVLLDKAGFAESLASQPIPHAAATPPSKDEFATLVNDFWYHTVWSTKKLRRGETWAAKSCLDCYMKRHLLKVIEWHTHLTCGWDYDTWHDGRFIDTWAAPHIRGKLATVYAHYDIADIRRSLLATMDLFRTLAIEVAERLTFEYPAQADHHATNWVTQSLLVDEFHRAKLL
jgi:aminoglycoside 6-adenylyltransferase